MAYEVKTIDLAAVGEKILAESGREMSGILLSEFPSGTELRMRIGRGMMMTVRGPFAFELCGEDARHGAVVENTIPQAGTVLEFMVLYGDGLTVPQ